MHGLEHRDDLHRGEQRQDAEDREDQEGHALAHEPIRQFPAGGALPVVEPLGEPPRPPFGQVRRVRVPQAPVGDEARAAAQAQDGEEQPHVEAALEQALARRVRGRLDALALFVDPARDLEGRPAFLRGAPRRVQADQAAERGLLRELPVRVRAGSRLEVGLEVPLDSGTGDDADGADEAVREAQQRGREEERQVRPPVAPGARRAERPTT